MGKADGTEQSGGENPSATDRRFAYSLLEKLIKYLDVAALSMKHLRPSGNFSRKTSFKTSTRDVKFFSKVNHLVFGKFKYIKIFKMYRRFRLFYH